MNRSESQAGLGPEHYASSYWGASLVQSPEHIRDLEDTIDESCGFSIVPCDDLPGGWLGPRAPRISNGARAQAELDGRYGGAQDKHGEHNSTDSEDYGHLRAEGGSRPEVRSGLYSPIIALAEKAEEDADFRDLETEKEKEEGRSKEIRKETIKALKAAWDAMTPEQQEAARREGNQRIAKRALAASRDESRDRGDRKLALEEVARRIQQGAHLELTGEERESLEEITRKWQEEEPHLKYNQRTPVGANEVTELRGLIESAEPRP